LTIHLHDRLDAIPARLAAYQLTLAGDGNELVYTYDTQGERSGITALLARPASGSATCIPRKTRSPRCDGAVTRCSGIPDVVELEQLRR
jgi:hypothetical protein